MLVKIFYSGICHTQLLEIAGKNAAGSFIPNLMGHEASGEVIRTGTGVSKVKKRVIELFFLDKRKRSKCNS